jgi:PAS domain-containing protein
MTIARFIRHTYDVVQAYSGTRAIKDQLLQQTALVVQDENEQPIGVLTPQDVVQHYHTLVIDCLTARPSLSSECTLEEALRVLQEAQTDVLAVMDGGALTGLIYKNDLLAYVTDQNKSLEGEVSKHVTELQSIHKELILSRQILQAVLDSTQSTVVLVAPDYSILYFNKKAGDESHALYGRMLETGMSILDYTLHDPRVAGRYLFDAFKSDFDRALAGESVVTERKVQLPEISRWLRAEYAPVYYQERIIGATITVTDIDERKRHLLQIERQNELLKHISWVQSHYTRQPVATILGLTSIIEKATLSEENIRIISMLEATAQKLDEVIRNTVLTANSLEEER